MAAKRGKTQAKRSGGMKYGVVLLVGLAIGLGLAVAYFVYGDRSKLDAILPQPNPQAEAPTPSRDREPVAQEPETPAETPKPTYDFYTVLPEKEVELPGQAADAAAPAPSTAPGAAAPPAAAANAPASASPSVGQLQAGAFSNAGDAEALRAKLALLGQTARIETVEANGRTLHRVRLGPYADAAALDSARKTLADAGISATPAR